MITFTSGDILKSGAEALVNTVNCVGVMGRGVALQFKNAFQDNYEAYARACEAQEVQPGRMFVYERHRLDTPRFIINFPTKRHWRGKSRMEDIDAGLIDLVRVIRERKIRSIAIPPLGSGLGGLDWRQVRPRIKKLSGAFLHRNWLSIPHITQNDEADITELEAFRKSQGEEARKTGIKFTVLGFLIKAVVVALKEYPHFNASLAPDGESLVLKQYFHIGVAVDTPNGLVVPVIRDADKKGLREIAKELGEVSSRMRDGKINPADLQGGCFSISSLGGLGGTHFTPIINAPEVAILGVGKASMRPVWDGKQFVPRLMLPLSLSYDHRVIDGAQGARFIAFLGSVLSDIRRLVL